jgi:hypothetical protein
MRWSGSRRANGAGHRPYQGLLPTIPSPGRYVFEPPKRGHPPEEIIVETMGYIDVQALVAEIDPPAAWRIVPAELVSGLVLDAQIEFEDVKADEEYQANEPADLEEARRRFRGKWDLSIAFPLEASLSRSDTQYSLDRREFELDARLARLVAI